MHEQLGVLLVESRACNSEQIAEALERQRGLASRNHYKHLGAILLEMRVITLGQLQRALERQAENEKGAGADNTLSS